MNNNNLVEVSNSFINFLWLMHNNMLKGNNIFKDLSFPVKKLGICTDEFQMPPSHLKVIFYLAHSGSSSISQVAKTLDISKSNMTPIIDKLIFYGLVTRYTDLNDRRILRIELTEKAIKLFTSVRESACKSFTDKISKLTDEEILMLNDSISNLIILLDKLNDIT